MVYLLRSKLSCFLSLLGILWSLSQCANSNKESGKADQMDSAQCATTKPLNPNGDSEMALLMRAMLDSSASLRELIKQGKLPGKFPEAFLTIHTAKLTDPSEKTAVFDAFAADYVNGLNALYGSQKEQVNENYNLLIQKCVNCHQEFCPGPIKRINKLKIDA